MIRVEVGNFRQLGPDEPPKGTVSEMVGIKIVRDSLDEGGEDIDLGLILVNPEERYTTIQIDAPEDGPDFVLGKTTERVEGEGASAYPRVPFLRRTEERARARKTGRARSPHPHNVPTGGRA